MAVEFKVDHKRGSEYLFYPDEITIKSENNGRYEPGKVEKLVKSFSTVGQLQPVSIQNEGGRPVLVAGFNRWQAAMRINEGKPREQQMRLACVYKRGSALETTVMNIHENHYRNPTVELDDAHNIARLMDRFGKTEAEVAEIYDEPIAWVKKRLKLLKLTDDAKRAMIDGEIKATAAEKIAALDATQQKQAVDNGGKPPAPKRPSPKAVIASLDTFSASPGVHAEVRKFAVKMMKYLAGEITEKELL